MKPIDLSLSSVSCAVAEPCEVTSLEVDLAVRGPVEGAEQLQQRRLARAARPHDHEELAAGDLEVDVAHGMHLVPFWP